MYLGKVQTQPVACTQSVIGRKAEETLLFAKEPPNFGFNPDPSSFMDKKAVKNNPAG